MKGMLNKNTLTLVSLLLFLILLVGCFPLINQSPIIISTPITLAEVNELYTYEVKATDPDGDSLTYSLEVKPSGMTIISATGLIKWIPTAKGDYLVVVKVSDGTLDITQSFTIVVSEAEEPGWTPTGTPIITSTPITTATVGVTYFYDVNATDPNGDTLTYFLTAYPPGMTISSASGLIMWTPTTKGAYAVIVEVSDGALSDTQGFTIVVSELPVVNQAPIITSIPSLTSTVGIKYTYTINATDPDGDTITYSLVSEPTGMSFDGIATISWTPVLGQVGTHGVTVKASDGILSNTQSFTITVGVTPPETYTITATAGPGGSISPSGDVTVDEGSDEIFTITPDSILYNIEEVLVDGSLVTAVSTYTFTDVTENHTIHVTFTFKLLGFVYNQDEGTYHDTIKEAIDSAKSGNTILVAAGYYPEQLNIYESLSIIGVSRDSVIIDANLFGSGYGISIIADDVTLKNFTLIGPNHEDGFGIHTSGSNNVTFENLLVRNSGRSGVDFIGSSNITINNIEAINNGGVGIAITNSSDVTVGNIITSGNKWVIIPWTTGMAVFASGGMCSNITLTGDNSFGEDVPFYTEAYDGGSIANLFVKNDFKYILRYLLDPLHGIAFFSTLDDALNFGAYLIILGIGIVAADIEVNDVITEAPLTDYGQDYF